jgi:hypothetical protein
MRESVLDWAPAALFLAGGLGVLTAFHARTTLRRAVFAAAAPAAVCLLFGTAMLGGYLMQHRQNPEAGMIVLFPGRA